MRTRDLGSLRKSDLDQKVVLSGWVHRRRDHGGLIFIDLRDRFGITQVVFDPKVNPEVHEKAHALRSEWVITVTGQVKRRAEGMVNPNMVTGEIEIETDELSILSRAKTPPFSIADETIDVHEELRLKYRYLDFRRGPILDNLLLRHKAQLAARNFLSEQNFTEISTPILGKSTPEGARDYLVPSRTWPGSFYALPQSPQLFKQLMMVGGLDRYFQIATCFRDEDLRADRQAEFTQIDIEMSFATEKELFPLIEQLMSRIFEECGKKRPSTPFLRMPYKEAVEHYGTDKPDLRYEMRLVRVDEIVEESEFSVFKDQLTSGGCVKGLCVKGGAFASRKQIDGYTHFVSKFGAHGLAWIKIQEEGPTSSIVKFFSKQQLDAMMQKMGAEKGDLLLFVASSENVVNQSLDHLRRLLAKERALVDPEMFAFAWITDFPLFEWDEQSQSYACAHHPFTSPHPDDIPLLDSDPLAVRSGSYDLVLNGYELSSGSQRIHDSDLQTKIFSVLKMPEEEIKKRFGFFLDALQYGTPPHLGTALGLDRIVMILAGTENMRDVIAFPKTQRAQDLMMQAPSSVEIDQLTELKIHVSETQ